MRNAGTNKNGRAFPFSYLKKGFWISLGAAAGITTLGLGLVAISLVFRYSHANIERLNIGLQDTWDGITLTTEQTQFKSCYKIKERTHGDYWLWKRREKYIPCYIGVLCEKEGFKVSGRFLKQYKKLDDDICKEILGGVDC